MGDEPIGINEYRKAVRLFYLMLSEEFTYDHDTRTKIILAEAQQEIKRFE